MLTSVNTHHILQPTLLQHQHFPLSSILCDKIPPVPPLCGGGRLEGTELPAQLAGRSRTAGRALGQACHGICVTFGGVSQYRGVPWQAPWPLHYVAAFHFVSLPISSVHCSVIQGVPLLPTTCENSHGVLRELWLSPSILTCQGASQKAPTHPLLKPGRCHFLLPACHPPASLLCHPTWMQTCSGWVQLCAWWDYP